MKALSQKRRHPLAAVVLLALALILTGGLYTVATATNQAKAESNHAYTQQDVEAGQKLFRQTAQPATAQTPKVPPMVLR